jgi:hypothetical protein
VWVRAAKAQHTSLELQEREPSMPDYGVGRKVLVYWPEDKAWYCGRVHSYSRKTGKRKIVYTDMQSEQILVSENRVLQFYSEASAPIGVGGSGPKDVVSLSTHAGGNRPVELETAVGGNAYADRDTQSVLAESEAEGNRSAAGGLGSRAPAEEPFDSQVGFGYGEPSCSQSCVVGKSIDINADQANGGDSHGGTSDFLLEIENSGIEHHSDGFHSADDVRRNEQDASAEEARSTLDVNPAACHPPVQCLRRKRIPTIRDQVSKAPLQLGYAVDRQRAVRQVLSVGPSAVFGRGHSLQSEAGTLTPKQGRPITCRQADDDVEGQSEQGLSRQAHQRLGGRRESAIRRRSAGVSRLVRHSIAQDCGLRLPLKRIGSEALLRRLFLSTVSSIGSGAMSIEVRYKGKFWGGRREADGRVLELLTGELYPSTREWVENCRLGVGIPSNFRAYNPKVLIAEIGALVHIAH